MAIQWLPRDPILYIFSYLNMQELSIIARVSKEWNALASHNTIWFRIARMNLPHSPSPPLPPPDISWKAYFQYLKSLMKISEIVWNRKVFYSAFGNTIGCWEPLRRETKYRFTATLITNCGIITCFALRHLGLDTFMITGSVDGSIRIWVKMAQTTQFILRTELYGHETAITRISGMGNNFFSGDEKGRLCFWEHTSQDPLYKLQDRADAHLSRISCTATSTRGIPELLFTGSHDATIKIWKLKDHRLHCYQALEHEGEAITSICYSTLQKILFSGTETGVVRLWRNDGMGNFSFTNKFDASKQAITRIYSLHQGSFLATSDTNLTLKIWMGSRKPCEKWSLQRNFSFKGDGLNACIAEDIQFRQAANLLVYYADNLQIQKRRLSSGGCKLLSTCQIPIPRLEDSGSEEVDTREDFYSPD